MIHGAFFSAIVARPGSACKWLFWTIPSATADYAGQVLVHQVKLELEMIANVLSFASPAGPQQAPLSDRPELKLQLSRCTAGLVPAAVAAHASDAPDELLPRPSKTVGQRLVP